MLDKAIEDLLKTSFESRDTKAIFSLLFQPDFSSSSTLQQDIIALTAHQNQLNAEVDKTLAGYIQRGAPSQDIYILKDKLHMLLMRASLIFDVEFKIHFIKVMNILFRQQLMKEREVQNRLETSQTLEKALSMSRMGMNMQTAANMNAVNALNALSSLGSASGSAATSGQKRSNTLQQDLAQYHALAELQRQRQNVNGVNQTFKKQRISPKTLSSPDVINLVQQNSKAQIEAATKSVQQPSPPSLTAAVAQNNQS
eukprot:snap_masked-scaffold_1-processed-gene-5.32-mRNA-1 protein AED:1.00 eAED:1.00 QI:0/-1/0/0/-1/1/1/0/254